ncbi:hypothetical protein FBU30_001355 [Linnemannia zychae]|nr:hypothetical protein FBU30_001355 [Linnemannia zychae]
MSFHSYFVFICVVNATYAVKSVDLDSWTAEQVENMIKWGNEKTNKFWEARLPESSIPNENTVGIDQWIRSKYEWKQYANRGPIPDPADLGPIDDAMLADLRGPLGRPRIHMDRSPESTGSLGIIAPPPSTLTRPFAHKPAGSHLTTSAQNRSLFSIDPQPRPKQQQPLSDHTAHHDFFGLTDPTPTFALGPPQKQTLMPNKRASAPPLPTSSAAQDLFSLNISPTTSAPSSQAANSHQADPNSNTQPKTNNADWKNSIMSLYGNQSTVGNRSSIGTNIGQQQQQQQQRPQSGQFNLAQGMDSFGNNLQHSHQQDKNKFGTQQHQQPYPQPHQPQQQQSIRGNNSINGFGNIQQGTPSFGSGYNNGFGGQTQHNFKSTSSSNQVNFFDAISSVVKPSVSDRTSISSAQNNKTSSAFGDLSWN